MQHYMACPPVTAFCTCSNSNAILLWNTYEYCPNNTAHAFTNAALHAPAISESDWSILSLSHIHTRDNIRVCYGCKQCYTHPVKQPNDLFIMHWQCRMFNMPGNPIPQSRFSHAYYHPHIACIQSVWPQFSPSLTLLSHRMWEIHYNRSSKRQMCLAVTITILYYWNMFMFTILILYNTSCYNTMCSIDQLFM